MTIIPVVHGTVQGKFIRRSSKVSTQFSILPLVQVLVCVVFPSPHPLSGYDGIQSLFQSLQVGGLSTIYNTIS